MTLEKEIYLTFEKNPKLVTYEDIMYWSEHNVFSFIKSIYTIKVNKLK